MFFDSFDGVFSAVQNGLCRYGILPIENSTAGSVNKVYDLMSKNKFYIVRSIRLKVDHSLLAKKGTSLTDVKEIFSHEQAINQCSEFLNSLSGVKVTVCANTAMAAKMVAVMLRLYLRLTVQGCTGFASCPRIYRIRAIITHVLYVSVKTLKSIPVPIKQAL